jgi:HEPN domain-containing protein
MKEKTDEWIAKAETDFSAAGLLLEHGEEHIVESVCFHCQQCAEKYLKGFLDEQGIAFPKEHILAPLIKLSHAIDPEFVLLNQYSERLENYAVAIRYPGTTATRSQAEAALAAATHIRTFVRRKLGLSV